MTDSRRWTIVGLLTFGMMMAFLDRATLSVALASADFKNYFGLTDTGRGILNSAFFWTYALLQIPVGVLVDRWGSVRTYSWGYTIWSIAAGGMAFARSLPQMIGLRLLLGVGEAPVTPASLRWIGKNLPEEKRGLAVGLLFAGAKLGPAFGSFVAAWILATAGWRWMFVVTGIGGLLWLIPWRLLAVEHDRAAPEARVPAEPLMKFLRMPLMWGIMIGTFSYNYFQYFCLTWLPSYFVERRGLELKSMGWYTMFSFGGMAIVATAAGWWADRLISGGADPVVIRRRFTLAGLLVASTELIGAYSQSHTVALVFAVLSLSGLGLATANYWALTQTLLPGSSIGRVTGLQNFASNLSGIIAPMLTGWLIDRTGSYDAPMLAVALVLAAGFLSYLTLVKRPRTLSQPV